MKTLLKIILIVGTFFSLAIFSVRAEAAYVGDYILTNENGEYTLSLYSSDGEISKTAYTHLSDAIDSLRGAQNSKIVFADVITSENIIIEDGKYLFGGSISFIEEGGITVDGGEVTLSGIEISLSAPLRVKSGKLTLDGGEINAADGKSAVILDYASNACFEILSGSINSSSDVASVFLKYGSLEISGGSIRNSVGAAIESLATVSLSGSPTIRGGEYDILSSLPISLSISGQKFDATVDIKYNSSFEKGELETVFYRASADAVGKIRVFDIYEEEMPLSFFSSYPNHAESNFIAVYLPHTVSYYVADTLLREEYKLSGEVALPPEAPENPGYRFVGWSSEAMGEGLYDFAAGVSSDISLYAVYKLQSPTFSFDDLEFTYDGKSRTLAPTNLDHPILSSGILSYEWYKDGVVISDTGAALALLEVDDSGLYKCKLTFTCGRDSVSAFTPEVEVKIKKAIVPIPEIKSVYYNGSYQSPDVYSTSLYTVSPSGGVVVGIYPVEISLADSKNYCFDGSDKSILYLDFEILKADNFFTDHLAAFDIYESQSPRVSAASRFGEVRYTYSTQKDGKYSSGIPTESGIYFVRAEVSGNENYFPLVSEPVEFKIIDEEIVGLSLLTPPTQNSYVAFDEFSPEGLVIRVGYNSSRTEDISYYALSFRYQSAENFRYGDTAVIAEYGGFSIPVPISVSKADYDLSSLSFENTTLHFNGKKQSISFSGEIPLGMDGSRPLCSVIGGGTNVGSYTVALVFENSSSNYNTPKSIERTLVILPFETSVVWENTEFVYDGTAKSPTAYYTDIYGRRIVPEVLGARSLAGEYTAVASSSDGNYALNFATISYVIKKADYDFSDVYWNDEAFIYDASRKSVFISGLPMGVSVIGYSNNTAVAAGKYKASVSLSYDENNYNPPPDIIYEWFIEKAEYDLSGFYFENNSSVFDGEFHFPILVGEMPRGLDGSILSFSFSRGVRNVSDGRCEVEIVFSSESENYALPKSITAFVEILPLGIEVEWGNGEFVYNGAPQLPEAHSSETSLKVVGAATDAGEYTARAISLDSNYEVINSEFKFCILRADNAWILSPTVKDIFEGKPICALGEALAGEVRFLIYYDADCQKVAAEPLSHGKYYLRAVSDGDKNHNPISSEILSFSVIEVVPVGISVSLREKKFSAFDTVNGVLSVTVINNDESRKTAAEDIIRIIYQNGDSLRYGDSFITVECLGYIEKIELEVKKADYDTSGVIWGENEFIYDGKEKLLTLSGLPDGVSIISLSGGRGTDVGEYPVSLTLSYDRENYNPPVIPECTLIIHKCKVDIPLIAPMIYNGNVLIPSLDEALFLSQTEGASSVGKYKIGISLKDSENYEFVGGGAACEVWYEIIPRDVSIALDALDKYLFEALPEPGYTIVSGEICDGDSLALVFEYSENEVTASSLNPNYKVTVIPGKINSHSSLSKAGLTSAMIIFSVTVALLLLCLAIVLHRRKIVHFISMMRYRLAPTAEESSASVDIISEASRESVSEGEITEPAPSSQDVGDEETLQSASCGEAAEESDEGLLTDEEAEPLGVDVEYADSMITNALARSLVRKSDIIIPTVGKRKRIINVDTLSESFNSGETVDVNELKARGLLPSDTAYIKVLARGRIDKPLRVLANDFSLSAVKMIALSGGEAIRVTTVLKSDGRSDSEKS